MADTRASEVFRVYEPHELGKDGYPPEWHATIKHAVRAAAGNRCVRCLHPFVVGESSRMIPHPLGDLRILAGGGTKPVMVNASLCDDQCRHDGPIEPVEGEPHALWRILTVHHIDQDKANCRWWNLAALCQRCHLTIQRKVDPARVWPWEHSDWFKPYVAGYYASVYLGEELSRPEAEARLDELLALERVA